MAPATVGGGEYLIPSHKAADFDTKLVLDGGSLPSSLLLHALRWMYPDFVDSDKDDDDEDSDSDSSEDPESDPCAFLVPAFELEDFFLSVCGLSFLFTLLFSTTLFLFLKNNNNLLLQNLLLPLPTAIQPSKFHRLKAKIIAPQEG